jgi:hypothetical protein
MKSYTDIKQSRKLSEILPLESADMFLAMNGTVPVMSKYIDEGLITADETAIPAWSLAALISILPNSIYDNTDEYSQLEFSKISVAYHDMNDGIKVGSIKDNLVDACYEMILKLHELNLL